MEVAGGVTDLYQSLKRKEASLAEKEADLDEREFIITKDHVSLCCIVLFFTYVFLF